MKDRLKLLPVHFVPKSNAFRAVCGQDAPPRRSIKRAKVTCKQCQRTRAFRRLRALPVKCS